MYESVSVEQAISRGNRMVTYPGIAIMLSTMALSVYEGSLNIYPPWIIGIGIALAFVLAWLYWSVMITKWRLWAFENVRNVHELKKQAIKANLIWPDGSWFAKTEIRNSEQQRLWEALQVKFSRPDEFLDDLSIPSETVIYYSKAKNFFEMAIGLGCIGLGFYLVAKGGETVSQVIGGILCIAGIYLSIKEFRQATNRDPQITINQQGILLASGDMFSWQKISNEDVKTERHGKSSSNYLVFDHPGGQLKLNIDDFDTTEKAIYKLLTVYRGRYERDSNRRKTT